MVFALAHLPSLFLPATSNFFLRNAAPSFGLFITWIAAGAGALLVGLVILVVALTRRRWLVACCRGSVPLPPSGLDPLDVCACEANMRPVQVETRAEDK